ncbi:MAG TPA: NAD(P) transhydrogenase subunit alpha [Saprospiraceae bacterium]|nr:NAD(P) transhydrogenase subunit alpha [Saprospiraceae bacterium]
MTLGLLKESNDPRVALTPANLAKLAVPGLDIVVESGAGDAAFFSDAEYAQHARVVSRKEVLHSADLLVSVFPPEEDERKQVKFGAVLVSQFQPFVNTEIAAHLNEQGLVAFSLDMIPRTTLAQAMDVLSSMASIAGYQAVLIGAAQLSRYVPMMVTAAGSIKPSKVLVLGAGVAGLQAIATARRLGASVEAFDTRAAAKEEVESLGAKFVEVEGAVDDRGAGGYAVQQSEEFLQRQRAEVQARAAKADLIITTAQVRGRKAPLLLPAETVEKMRPGSVVVDLAASTGGNCNLTQDGKTVRHNGVSIVGDSNLAARMPQDASTMFGNNVTNFLKLLINKEGALHLDFNNEIVRESCIAGHHDKPAA